MAICIYCKQNKPKEDFSKDHVWPSAFGRFKNNLVLSRQQVCSTCNQELSKVEGKLATGTHEGNYLRFEHGVKSKDSFKVQYGYGCAEKRVVSQGDLKGLELIVYDGQKSGPANNEVVGLRRGDGSYDFFSIDKIPEKRFFVEEYPEHEKRILILFKDNEEEVRSAISEILSQPNIKYKVSEVKEVKATVIRKITSEIKRAIAKIGFNYLAYHNLREVILHEAFDPIRNFILKGENPIWEPVEVSKEPILGNEENSNKRLIGHLVNVWTSQNAIMAQVSLFNVFTYNIILGKDNGKLPNLKTGFGSFYNLSNSKIVPISKSSLVILKKPPLITRAPLYV